MFLQQSLTLEATFPKFALAAVFPIGLAGDRFIQRFHEPAQAAQALSQFGHPLRVARDGQSETLGRFRAVVVFEWAGKGRQPALGDFFVAP